MSHAVVRQKPSFFVLLSFNFLSFVRSFVLSFFLSFCLTFFLSFLLGTSFIPSFSLTFLVSSSSPSPPPSPPLEVGGLVSYTSQQHASVSQGRICPDNWKCCHTETEVSDRIFCFTHSKYTDTRSTSPSGSDPRTPGARQGYHWSANF